MYSYIFCIDSSHNSTDEIDIKTVVDSQQHIGDQHSLKNDLSYLVVIFTELSALTSDMGNRDRGRLSYTLSGYGMGVLPYFAENGIEDSLVVYGWYLCGSILPVEIKAT